MLIGILFILLSLVLLILGSLKPILLLFCIGLGLAITIIDVVSGYELRKKNNLIKRRTGAVYVESFAHIQGLGLAHMQELHLLVFSDGRVEFVSFSGSTGRCLRENFKIVYLDALNVNYLKHKFNRTDIPHDFSIHLSTIINYINESTRFSFNGLLLLLQYEEAETIYTIALRPLERRSQMAKVEALKSKYMKFDKKKGFDIFLKSEITGEH